MTFMKFSFVNTVHLEASPIVVFVSNYLHSYVIFRKLYKVFTNIHMNELNMKLIFFYKSLQFLLVPHNQTIWLQNFHWRPIQIRSWMLWMQFQRFC